MHEIEKLLNDNIGNRLTRELVIGLFTMISHHTRSMLDEARVEGLKAELPPAEGE